MHALILAVIIAVGAEPGAAPVERLRGVYLQQAVEIATVAGRPIFLTRMTKFRRCGNRRGIAEDFNGHIVEVLGRDFSGIGFVAGIVTAVEGCDARPARWSRDLNPR